jgi:hypothetical protein
VGLVVANFWFGGSRSAVSAGLFGSGDPGVAHKALIALGGEMLFVIVATVLAGISSTWAATMTFVIVALAILWAINHYSSAKKPAPTQGATTP